MRRIYFIILALVLLAFSFNIGFRAGNSYPPEELFDLVTATISGNQTGEEEAPDSVEEEAFEEGPKEEPEAETEPEPDLRTADMVVAGDITAHVPQIEQAYLGEGNYDFTPSFEIIEPYLKKGDITVGDLETAQAGPEIRSVAWGVTGYTGFPEFNAPQEFSEALQQAGFNTLTIANNHTMDRGYEGLIKSLSHVRSLGLETFGAYKSQEERDTPTIIEHDGIKIAFIGYTYGLNGIPVPEGHQYCVNYVPDFQDITPVIEDIARAKDHGADLVAVFPHWGSMYVSEPQPQRLRDVAAQMAAAGADLIMGGHPHYIQPIEWFFNDNESGGERATLAIYSLGNFISNQHYPHNPSPFVEYGILLDIELTKNKDSGEAWISGVDFEITWVHRDWRHRILPLSEVFAGSPDDYNLSQSQVDELKTWHQKNIEVLETYGHSEDKSRAMEISEMLYNKAYQSD